MSFVLISSILFQETFVVLSTICFSFYMIYDVVYHSPFSPYRIIRPPTVEINNGRLIAYIRGGDSCK